MSVLCNGRSAEVLVELDHDGTTREVMTKAARLGLEPPVYEGELYLGVEYPEVQQEKPAVFLHDPWLGFFGRRAVLCLWSDAGRNELALEGFDDPWRRDYRFAFMRPAR